MWVLLICPVIAWGMCSVQMPTGLFETREACVKAASEVFTAEKPAMVYCSNVPYQIERAKAK